MKRFICAVLCVCMLLSFGGCDAELMPVENTSVATTQTEKAHTTQKEITTVTQKTTTSKTTEKTTTQMLTTTHKPTTEKSVPTTKRVVTTKQKTTTKRITTKATENETQSKSVYITPTGKRYHFDPDCGGKNSYAATMDIALGKGLTPCKKCAN